VRKVDGWNFEADLGPSSRAAVAPAPPPATRKTTRPAAHPQASARRSGPAAGRPRLSLELLDVAIDQAAPLKPSGTLAAPGQPGALPRAEAAAAWQALRTPPTPEVAQALQAANEAELRQLRGLAQRQADQLNKLEHERDLIRDIVAALAGAIALGLGVLLWRRTRETRRAAWWDDEQDRDRQPLRAAPPPPAPAPPPEDVDSGWSEMGASQVSSQPATLRVGLATLPDPTTAPVAAPAVGFGDSVLGRGRLPSAEELLDVQERANFFMAINQHDQAIELLETRLLEHYGTSPFLWLDLLDLCRTLDRPDDYERVRRRFQRAFAARLPAFEAPPEHSEGLERYPRALSRIELLWPTQKVLQEIEKSLFAAPADGAIQFDLEASRELLLLYSIASEVVEADASLSLPGVGEVPSNEEALATQPVPLIDLDLNEPEPVVAHGLDLDVDFTALESPPPAATSAAPPLPSLDLDLDALVPGRFR
jgi:hypothetical protein